MVFEETVFFMIALALLRYSPRWFNNLSIVNFKRPDDNKLKLFLKVDCVTAELVTLSEVNSSDDPKVFLK